MFSVLNIHKPLGITSHDVVSAVRRVFNLKKVGHAGTLDPMAEGVLPVCLGQGTRLIEYFATDKRYRLEITLGVSTHTLDREGEEIHRQPCPHITPDDVTNAFQPFIGTFEQEIPAHSAKRVNGKKLYTFAHKGIETEALSKTVTVHQVELIEFRTNDREDKDFPVVVLDVHCGSGTFMRAIARDLGLSLGCGAYLSGLIRTHHGRFSLDHAVPLEVLKTSDTPEQFLLNPIAPDSFIELPLIELEAQQQVDQLRHGMKIPLDALPPHASKMRDKDLCLLTYEATQPIAVAQWSEHKLKPVKVFSSLVTTV